MKMPMSLCMIVKDEEEFLDGCLKSATPYFDDIVVVDTGSSDRTKEIALNNGARVFDFVWCNDFSAARNFSAGQAHNDWIFVIDADEEIVELNGDEVMRFTELPPPLPRGSVKRLEVSHKLFSDATRLYNRRHYHYKGKIHEQVRPINATDNDVESIVDLPVLLNHYGYSPDILASKQKLERNERMLLQELDESPNDPYILYQLGKGRMSQAGQASQACEYFEKALAQNPDIRLDYVYSLIECYGYTLINSEQYDKALTLGKKYLDNFKKRTSFRFLLGHIYQNNGLLIEAVEWYESCLEAEDIDFVGISSYLAYYNIGVILECIGMTDDAVSMYKNCGDYEPALLRLKLLK